MSPAPAQDRDHGEAGEQRGEAGQRVTEGKSDEAEGEDEGEKDEEGEGGNAPRFGAPATQIIKFVSGVFCFSPTADRPSRITGALALKRPGYDYR